jgi:protein TonB
MKTSDSYLQLLFENRNKAYGAYELRTNYDKRLLKAFGLALSFAALVFLIPFVLTLIFTHPKKIGDIIASIPIDLQKTFVIEKPESYTALPVKSHVIAENNYHVVRNVPVEMKPEEIKKDNTDANRSNSNGPSTTTNPNPVTTVADPPLIVSESAPMNLASVDTVPRFPGGEKAMMKFLEKNLHFTAFARENGIAGKIFAAFIVNEKGQVVNIEIRRSVEATLDDEVVRVLKLMPSWSPGIYHGNPVKTAMSLPVSFNITK